MTFLSAEEDFRIRTLGAIAGALRKLAYLAGLRRAGRYEHWGMIRSYGDDVSQSAIGSNHSRVFLDVLASPLEELLRDEELPASNAAGHELDSLRMLRESATEAVPIETAGGVKAHLSFVVESVWQLRQAAQASIHRVA